MRRKNWHPDVLRPVEYHLIRKQEVQEGQRRLLKATENDIDLLTFTLSWIDDDDNLRTEREIENYSIISKGTVGNRKRRLLGKLL